MNNEDLINEVKAKKRKTKQTNNFEGGDTVLNSQLVEARNAVKNQTKAFIFGGISDALYEIANGDFGDAGIMALDMLNNTFTLPIEIETELIQEELAPKQFLLTSEKSSF